MPFVDFKAVKQQVSMLQVIERYRLKLKRSGDSLSGVCPIHKGSNPTQFRVSVSKNCWNCFGKCQRGGNILDFVAGMEGVGIRDAALLIQEWFALNTRPPAGQEIEGQAEPEVKLEEPPMPEAPEPNKPLSFSLTNLDTAHPYLTERGLDSEAVATFGLGYCGKGMMSGRVVFPIHSAAGELVAYAGRWPGEPPAEEPKYRFPTAKNFRKALEVYNLHRVLREAVTAPLVVVEGFFDCIRLWQLGYRRTVALMGSSLSDAQAELLIAAGEGIILLFDEDDAGRKGREKALVKLASSVFVRVVELPGEGMQPEHLEADALRDLLNVDVTL